MIPYGAVFHETNGEKVVMVVGPASMIDTRKVSAIRDGDWYAIVVLKGVDGVDYSHERVPALRRVTNEQWWERIA